jgi:hypothetical protein
MSKNPEALTELQLDDVTGGRRMLFGAQAGSFSPGLFPRFRQMAQGTFMQHRQAGIAAQTGGGGGCPNGQCG